MTHDTYIEVKAYIIFDNSSILNTVMPGGHHQLTTPYNSTQLNSTQLNCL